MLRTRQTPSVAGSRIHIALDKRIWDGDLLAKLVERDDLPTIQFAKGEKDDVTELAELVVRRCGYRMVGWTDLGDEAWHDLEREDDEAEVGFHTGLGLYISSDRAEELGVTLKVMWETSR